MIRSVTTARSPAARDPLRRAGVGGVHRPDVEHPAGRRGAVVQADRRGVHRDPDRRQQPVSHARAPARRRGSRRSRPPAPRACAAPARMPGTARIGPIETTGLLGATRIRSAVADASVTPGAGRAASMPTRTTASASGRGVQPHPVLLEVDGPPAAGGRSVGDGDVGLDPVVGHRQQPQRGSPASQRGQRRGHLRQRIAGVRAAGCGRDGCRGPGRRGRTRSARRRTRASSSITRQLSSRRPQPRSASAPPPRVYIIVSRSGQIRRPCRVMSSAVLPITVIIGVRIRPRGRRARTGAADATGQDHDLHADSVPSPALCRTARPIGPAAGRCAADGGSSYAAAMREPEKWREPAAWLTIGVLALTVLLGVIGRVVVRSRRLRPVLALGIGAEIGDPTRLRRSWPESWRAACWSSRPPRARLITLARCADLRPGVCWPRCLLTLVSLGSRALGRRRWGCRHPGHLRTRRRGAGPAVPAAAVAGGPGPDAAHRPAAGAAGPAAPTGAARAAAAADLAAGCGRRRRLDDRAATPRRCAAAGWGSRASRPAGSRSRPLRRSHRRSHPPPGRRGIRPRGLRRPTPPDPVHLGEQPAKPTDPAPSWWTDQA